MAVVIGHDQVGAQWTGASTLVPNNPTAKLIYYLNCVYNVIYRDQDEDIRRYTNYSNWSGLPIDEKKSYFCSLLYV